ncbi:MAG: SPFH domain-containing protein [Clostridia bacterium]|nr:SPFH domain-containing protein [Clostridia bacterium]
MASKTPVIIEISEKDINVGRVMEKTEPAVVTPNMLITVPAHHFAIPYVDGEPFEKIRSCSKKKLRKFIGSDKEGKTVSVLYVSQKKLNTLPWGSGNLPIVYERFGGAKLRVGAGGTFTARIKDPKAFYDSLGRKYGVLTSDEVKRRIIAAFRNSISGILTELFIEAGEPVFNTDFMIDELERRINAAVCGKDAEKLAGVFFESAAVTDICVSEEDRIAFLEKYEKNKKEFLKLAKG